MKPLAKGKPRWDTNSYADFLGQSWKGNVVDVRSYERTKPDGTKSHVEGYRRRKKIHPE